MKRKTIDSDHTVVKDTSLFVRRWIEKQPSVKEETITDWLLFTISEKIPKVTYKLFTRSEEARITGADWEWWFVYPTYSFKMRVQAKKLFPNKDNYPGIAHTNQYGLQIDKLLDDAAMKNYAPFYAFYTAESGDVLCKEKINDEGVYMAGANNIYKTFIGGGKRQVQSSDALALSVALSCFFGCPLMVDSSEKESFAFFRRYFIDNILRNQNESDDDSSIQNTLGLYSEAPNYVSILLKNKENIPGWWESEFSHDLEGANAIMIYDGREY